MKKVAFKLRLKIENFFQKRKVRIWDTSSREKSGNEVSKTEKYRHFWRRLSHLLHLAREERAWGQPLYGLGNDLG